MSDESLTGQPSEPPLLAVGAVTKAFGRVQALADVTLEIPPGRIHALIGRNGSGKSTLVKVLAGYHRPDGGQIRVDGEVVEPWKAGRQDTRVAVVHQDLGVFPELSVTENFAIGRGFDTRLGRIRWKEEAQRTRRGLERFGIGRLANERLSSLPQVHAVIVAMARALDSASSTDKRVLLLDEPTSFLPKREVATLFAAMRQAAGSGLAVLFVTHRMEEVLDLAEEVTVLRDGRVALSRQTAGLGEGDLVAAMMPVGADRVRSQSLSTDGGQAVGRSQGADPGPPAIALRGVTGESLRNVDLEAYPGEVLGVTGLLASGIDELAYILGGHRDPVDGQVTLAQRPTGGRSQSIGVIPADRVRSGALTGLSVEENLSISTLVTSNPLSWISKRRRAKEAAQWVERLSVPSCEPGSPIESLSGGNQQKVILARWLTTRPQVLVAEGPTQGIDVGAKADVLGYLREAARTGVAVIIISYEAEEILAVCDRLAVLRGGSVVSEMRPDRVEVSDVLEAMG